MKTGTAIGPRLAAAGLALVTLAGCLEGLPVAGAGSQTAGEAGRAVPVTRRTELGGGSVVIVPPAGYCLDKSSISDRVGGAFALIASCESLTGRMGGVLVEPAVITVSVSGKREDRDQPEAAVLAQALPDAAALRETNGDGLTVVQVADDTGPLQGASSDTRHWRGAMVVNDRLVGLAVYGAPDSAIAGDSGERLLVALAESIRENSPFLASDAPVAPSSDETADSPEVPRETPAASASGE
ncbi:hypothetical protein M8756_14415 [Lutimaribacter sp. EGI FJ00015]|uniref:Uncharacterized protein n=1 Tax=Lutimaribacter degradans TaxID=2945989 RepID=A0ACC5ZZD8_9RHOB|nr:hypothetical protein [Lutimaribacter sp. EGI FJ00013]MCM2563412.1 hypothetical protein [Lutimaribacter sp. EGI FJ00013]MCO0614510.1 hypothetical protein [Lutimaribacter sp. EGI FJ00015]MCO0637183.1 hypothetical protein [Lutimaribacter sp. EGI FJ00014]